MVEINYKIVICGLVCLTTIYIGLIINGNTSETIGYLIITIIAMAIGVIIPAPKIDNKTGVLKW